MKPLALFTGLLSLALVAVILSDARQPVSATAGLSISGTLWEDNIPDGNRAADEPGIQWRVDLTSDSGAVRMVISNADGSYFFGDLTPGTYRVNLPDGSLVFYATYPGRTGSAGIETTVTLRDQPLTKVDFGLFSTRSFPHFVGLAWSDAAPVRRPDVRAFVNRKDCTAGGGIRPPDQLPSTFEISVASDLLNPGCGVPGSVIRFMVNGREANETAIWLANTRSTTDLVVGPPFAYFFGYVNLPTGEPDSRPQTSVEAFIGGVLCGSAHNLAYPGEILVVLPAVMRPGCGVDGALITFRVNGLPTKETAVWKPGEQTITVTPVASSISPAAAGDGGLAAK
jgi:hypothetical protein